MDILTLIIKWAN